MTGDFSRSNPSPRYQELLALYRDVHARGLPDQNIAAEDAFAGQSLGEHAAVIRTLIGATGARTLLDYGAGKGRLYGECNLEIDGQTVSDVRAYWGIDRVHLYDPAHAAFSTLPQGEFDAVVCTDVLEHVPQEDLPWVLGELFGYARKFVFANVASYPAEKMLPNGENAHATVQPPSWWQQQIERVWNRRDADYLVVIEEKRHSHGGLIGKVMGPRYRRSTLTSRAAWRDL